MQRKKMTRWISLDYLLDRCEREGIIFRDGDGKPSTAREAVKRFAFFCMTSRVELANDDDFNIQLRMEKAEQEAMSCQTAGRG